jgi:gliding motility-associated protein GldC
MSAEQTINKRSAINIAVSLNEEKHPVGIEWQAEDSGLMGERPAKAFMLALWDVKEKSTMRIDLWTPEMSVEEMQYFFYETLASMADTLERSTGDKVLSKEMRDYARDFGKKVKVLS